MSGAAHPRASPTRGVEEDSAACYFELLTLAIIFFLEAVKRRRPRLWSKSLGRLLVTLFIVFSFGPLLVSNLWGYLQSKSLLTEASYRDLRNMAELAALQTRRFVDDKENHLSSLATPTSGLLQAVEAVAEGRSAGEVPVDSLRTLRHLLADFADAEPTAEELLVLGADDAVLATSRYAASSSPGDTAAICGGTRANRPTVLGFDYSQGDEPSLILATALEGHHGRRIGVLCARYAFDVHRRLVATHRQHSLGATIYVLDQTGRVVCGSSGDIHAPPYGQPLHAAMSQIGIEPQANQSQGQPRESHGDDHGGHAEPPSARSDDRSDQSDQVDESEHSHRDASGPAMVDDPTRPWRGRYSTGPAGEEVLASYVPVSEVGWGVMVEVPTARALRELQDLRNRAFALSGLLGAVLLVTILFTSRSLTQRLRRLADAARRIAGGALGERVPAEGLEELRDLAESFNQMSLALEHSHRDLEDRIAARTRALQLNQSFLEQLLDAIDYFVVVIDHDGQITKANRPAREMLDADPVGRSYREVFGGLHDDGGADPVARSFETGEPASVERPRRSPEGQEIVAIETFPVRSPDDHVDSVVQVGRVVTAERQLQAQMVHHEKMAAVGLLAAGIAHEIGNPLAAIQSQLRMTRGEEVSERVGTTIEVVDKQVARISRLLRDLVDFARRKRDAVTLVSVEQVFDDVVRLLSHDGRASNVSIECHVSATLPGIRSREDQLLQVLLNLGINALDAMPDGGRLRFEAARAGGDVVEIRVSDSGTGVSGEAKGRLFEPFFTTKQRGRGTGLGLFVSRGIVEALGGELTLEQSGDAGAVFLVRLPVETPVQREDAPAPRAEGWP